MKALVLGLPVESALHRDLGLDWTVANELAALTAEIGYENYRATLATGGVKKGRLPKPLHIPRPKHSPSTQEPKPERRSATVDEVIAILNMGHRGL